MLFAFLLISGIYNSYSQIVVPFAPRPSKDTPPKTNYTIKGDFTMAGNTNMQLAGFQYPTNQHNGNDMKYVDVDDDPNTWNSSSAFLNFSQENGAIPECSNIIYAGIYWTGRAFGDNQTDTNTFQVTKNVPTGNTTTQQVSNTNIDIRDNDNIDNTNYSLDISTVGNGNGYTEFTFTSSGSGDIVRFRYYNDNNTNVQVSRNNGGFTVVTGSYSGNGSQYFQLNTAYQIFSDSNYTLQVSRLRKNNQARAFVNVTYNQIVPETIAVTKNFDKRKVLIKGPLSSTYEELNAEGIAFPNTEYGKMFSAYADVTEYVKQNGIGNYFVADIALREGNVDGTGFYGGWGMVVVYENSKMKWRDITVFDGHAYVRTPGTNENLFFNLPVSGFNAVQNGAVNLKLGLMAGEGDINYSGDYFQMLRQDTNTWESLSHSNNIATNFFNSSILTGGNTRNPNYNNNTGLDIVMFDVDNANNKFITNNQTSTSFRYGSLTDTYIIFNLSFSVDAYIPESEGVLTTTSINGNPNPPSQSLEPGGYADYKIEIKNKGTEALNNTVITIPLPASVNPTDLNIVYNTYAPFSTANVPTYDASLGANGSIVWNLGTLPVPTNNDTVLADIGFRLTATTNCTVLSNPAIGSNISLNGTITGIGAISSIPFNSNLIQGYQTSGLCVGEPIPTPSIIIIDSDDYVNQPPTASNPSPINVECFGNIPEPDVSVVIDEADNSGIPPIIAFVSDVSDNGTNPEIITRTYSVTDDCGNSINVIQTITIQDVTPPTIICPADISISANAGLCEASNVNIVAPTATDNCATTFTFTGTRSDNLALTAPYPVGTTTITWIANDGSNDSLACTQNIIINDTTDPVAPTLADITGECSVTATAPTTTDNCAGTITATTTDPLTYTTQGTFTINWTFDDGNGNSITVQQNVIVDDTTDPVAPILADLTGECSVTATAPTTTDNCAGTITATTTDPLTYSTQGTFVINWTFDDGNGNSITVQQNVIVDDTTDPVAPTLADLTGECSVTAIAPTTTDNCAGTITATTTDPLTYSTQGTFVINWTFDDGNGNSIIVPQNVIVDDTTDPVAPTLADITAECSVTATIPTIVDDCNGSIIAATTTDPLTYSTQGTFVINWTFDDGNGNSITVQQNVIIDDTTNPVAPTLADLTGECSVTATAPTTTDNCAGTITATTTDPLTYTTQGTFTINWTFDDGNGNSITVQQNVIIDDTTNPVAPILADLTGECSVTAIAPTTTDNCAGTITGTTTDPLTYSTQGTFVINWTFDDGNGNSITVQQNVIVDDTTDPVAPTLADLTGECSVTAIAPTTTDNCAGTITATTTDPLTYSTQGTFVINWTFDDGNGNSITVQQNVIVDDVTNPMFVETLPSDTTVECDDVPIAETLTATDNCGTATVTFNEVKIDGNCASNYTLERTWTATDSAGLTTIHKQTIIVQDTTAPVLVLPLNATAECSNDLSPISFGTATATDNCDANPIITFTDVVTQGPCPGSTSIIRTWTATDACGNSVSEDQIISTSDTTPPVFVEELPEDFTVECTTVPAAETLTATDNCGTAIVTFSEVKTNGNCANNYIISRTWTATDECGLTTSYTQTITVQDTTPPMFIEDLPGNITVECDAIPVAETLTATDSCGSATVTVTDVNTAGSCPNSYSIARTWTATDACGLTTTHTQIITVQDTKAPTFVQALPGNITVECDAIPNAQTLAAIDNCGTATVTVTDVKTNGECPNSYTIARTWTAIDECGLRTSHTQIITVEDTKAPTITTPFDAVLNVSCTDIPEIPSLQFTDSCSVNVTVTFEETSTFDETAFTDYQIVRTWIATDECGNSDTFTQTLNVALDEVVSQITAEDRCYDDGIVDLNSYLSVTNLNGTWELIQGDPTATLIGSLFNPTTLELSQDFLPSDGGIDYVFRYTTIENGCVSVTELTMNINADCAVLPCGENDVIISKAITPNGDGINETFDIMGIDLCGFEANVKIFNRWGALMFESDNYQVGENQGSWTGKAKSSIGNAETAPNGTYYYIVTLKNSGLKPFTGPIYLGTK